jgi:hypothetical protein
MYKTRRYIFIKKYRTTDILGKTILFSENIYFEVLFSFPDGIATI